MSRFSSLVTSGRRIVTTLATLGLLAGLLVAGTGTAAAAQAHSYICSGGDLGTFTPEIIPSGTYATINVTGFCMTAPGSQIVVKSGLSVATGGFLVASSGFDSQCGRSMSVGGGVTVAPYGSLFFGDGEGTGCPDNARSRVGGSLSATGALWLVVHGTSVGGGFVSTGGGNAQACNWDFPMWLALEDSTIGGGVNVSGYQACWLGFARNRINGGAVLANNVLNDPDAMEILSNHVSGGLACWGNSPVPTNWADKADGGPQLPNTVKGPETGQCAGL